MNKTFAYVAAFSFALSAAGCSTNQLASASAAIQSGAAVIADINGGMPSACASAALIAGDVGSAVAKVGAANPNNATVQSVVAKVNNGVALTAPDCALVSSLLASF